MLDTEPLENPCSQIPIILGWPFLPTVDALINCCNGVMKNSFGNVTMELNVLNFRRQPSMNDFNYVRDINLIDSVVNDSFIHFYRDDLLKMCIAYCWTNIEEDNMISEENSLLKSTPLMDFKKWKAQVEKPQKLDLKPLSYSNGKMTTWPSRACLLTFLFYFLLITSP